MSVPAFRNSKSRVRRRRAHHALKAKGTATCPKCQSPVLPHRACSSCGYYNGRQVTAAKAAPVAAPAAPEKKAQKKEKAQDAKSSKGEKSEKTEEAK